MEKHNEEIFGVSAVIFFLSWEDKVEEWTFDI